MTAQRPDPTSFRHAVPFTVEPVKLMLMESIRHLDYAGLDAIPHADIELGYFEADSPRIVRAVVERGIVTTITVDPCKDDGAEASEPDLVRLVVAARRRLEGRRSGRKWKPMPLRVFVSNLQRSLTIDSITCMRICFFGVCFVCCTTVLDTIFCGRRVIIHSP